MVKIALCDNLLKVKCGFPVTYVPAEQYQNVEKMSHAGCSSENTSVFLSIVIRKCSHALNEYHHFEGAVSVNS